MTMPEFFSLKGKVALVTGATGYLGKQIALTLAEAGAQVIIQGRNKIKVEKLAGELRASGFDASAGVFDLLDEKATKHFFEVNPLEKLNILVNNAYAGSGGTIESSSDRDYTNSYEIGLVSIQRLFNILLPYLRQGHKCDELASCINIASMYGLVSPDLSLYENAASTNPPFYGSVKAALIHWTRYAACEFGREGIRFNSVSPGPFPNRLAQENKEFIVKLGSKTALGRIGKAEEIKGVINFLSSNASSFVTGSNIVVDGGWTSN